MPALKEGERWSAGYGVGDLEGVFSGVIDLSGNRHKDGYIDGTFIFTDDAGFRPCDITDAMLDNARKGNGTHESVKGAYAVIDLSNNPESLEENGLSSADAEELAKAMSVICKHIKRQLIF